MVRRLLRLVLAVTALVIPAGSYADVAVVCGSTAPGINNGTITTAIVPLLARAGYKVRMWNPAELRHESDPTTANCALLVLPNCTRLPQPAIGVVSRYLQAGGSVFAAGTPVGTMPMFRTADGSWKTLTELQRAEAFVPPQHLILRPSSEMDISEWTRNSNTPSNPTTNSVTPESVGGNSIKVLRSSISNLQGWDTFESPVISDPFPNGNTVTVFTARGDKTTNSLAVEWDDDDGSRWIAVVPLTTHWQRYTLVPAQFKPWTVPGPRIAAGFLPQQATRISIGLAYSHTGAEPGAHSFEIAELGTAPTGSSISQGDMLSPQTALSPSYKFYRIHTASRLLLQHVPGKTGAGVELSQTFPADTLFAIQPRPAADGFLKDRLYRQMGLITARDARTGEWRGVPAALIIPGSVGSAMGMRLVFTPSNSGFYKIPAVQRLITKTLSHMRRGLFLVEAGTEYYTLFKNQACVVGAKVGCRNADGRTETATVKIVIEKRHEPVWAHSWQISVNAHSTASCSAIWHPGGTLPHEGDSVVTTLLVDGRPIDRSTMTVHEWLPPVHPAFVRTKPTGHFYYKNSLWRINGVNYMPSSGIGTSHGLYFESWMSARSYDARVVQRDLARLKRLGFNAVSAFIYTRDIAAQNLLDFLWRCRNLGLHVNLSLRPGVADYLADGRPEAERKSWANFKSIILHYDLRQNDTVFAYEISWEPSFGDYTNRLRLDNAWRRWVISKYGNVSAAEIAWRYSPPKLDGKLTGPSDDQLTAANGNFAHFVGDYRAFLDTWLQQTFGESVHRLHALDPNHLVSFRMASAGDGSYRWGGSLPYQLAGLSRAVDFLAPECYGRVGDPTNERTIPFELGYARGIAPHMPVIWAETGMSVWNTGSGRDSRRLLEEQGKYYSVIYRATIRMDGDGIFFWWYPGGYRVNEGSDFGLLNEDGTARPATRAVLKYGHLLVHLPPSTRQKVYLPYYRPNYPDGPAGVFNALDMAFTRLLQAGKMPIPLPTSVAKSAK